MKGITFGILHSFDDLDLILTSKEIGSPEVKETKIDIPGADSELDLTEFFGEAKYSNVTHKFEFSTIVPASEFLSLFSTIKNALHGKKMRIILDGDPHFYYVGRLHVSSFKNEKNIGQISIEADCEPYKYKSQPTIMTVTNSGTQAITLTNSRKRAVPEVVIANNATAMRIEYQGNIWDLGAGSYTLPELELVEGANTVTLTGTGTVVFTWQEAGL